MMRLLGRVCAVAVMSGLALGALGLQGAGASATPAAGRAARELSVTSRRKLTHKKLKAIAATAVMEYAEQAEVASGVTSLPGYVRATGLANAEVVAAKLEQDALACRASSILQVIHTKSFKHATSIRRARKLAVRFAKQAEDDCLTLATMGARAFLAYFKAGEDAAKQAATRASGSAVPQGPSVTSTTRYVKVLLPPTICHDEYGNEVLCG